MTLLYAVRELFTGVRGIGILRSSNIKGGGILRGVPALFCFMMAQLFRGCA
jgi:hypothetical protein